MAEVRVGVDTGGTFTDFLAFSDDGSLRASKTPSTPADDTEAFLTGLSNLREAGVEPGDVTSLNYGTTVALNAVLQKRWPPLGLIVTEGYRELIEIARQTVPGDWGAIYSWIKPPRVVPLENVQEARERITHKGEVVEGLNEDDIRAAATFYKEKEIGAVAICLMHSYRNAIHEQRARDVFREVHPDCFLTISSDVLPEFREYERAMTTCLNAALMPLVSDYLDHLEVRLKAANYEAPLLLMRSSGGLASANQVIEQPATIAYSGPSAGVLGMAWLARQIGEDKVLTYDMGGTSTDVALVENGEPLLTTEGFLDIYPMGTPSIDLVSIGAGGGSIAMLGTGDRLRVGPESAGADPGPVCYGKGGAAPTVTDANLVLGRIPGFLLGGHSMWKQPEKSWPSPAPSSAWKFESSPTESCSSQRRAWPVQSGRSRWHEAATPVSIRCSRMAEQVHCTQRTSPTCWASPRSSSHQTRALDHALDSSLQTFTAQRSKQSRLVLMSWNPISLSPPSLSSKNGSPRMWSARASTSRQ